jgi:hypothetical protein
MTNINFDGNFNYRGDYSSSYPSGEPSRYQSNDLILFEGKLYIANASIKGESPDTNTNWIPWGNSRVSFRSTKPPNTKIGDTWINSETGKFYTFLDDGDTEQWVEL